MYADSQHTSDADNACYFQNLENQHSFASFNALQSGLEKRHCAEIDIEEKATMMQMEQIIDQVPPSLFFAIDFFENFKKK